MLPSSYRKSTFLLLCILISLASIDRTRAAGRRSRVDTPVISAQQQQQQQKAAVVSEKEDALVLDDNIATASGSEPEMVKVEPLIADVKDLPVTEALISDKTDADLTLSDATTLDIPTVEECETDNIGYEIVTGYVFSAPGKLLDSIPGTLMLTDCLDTCTANEKCDSVNYETGLCVLFSSNADKLPGALAKSQFPVFTIYAQKLCFSVRPCDRPWCADRSLGNKLNGYVKRTSTSVSRHDCFDMCLGETDFLCRSANYYAKTGVCELSDMDRVTLAGTNSFLPSEALTKLPGADYLENNCAEEPRKLCEFKRLDGKILKTVDSVYQEIASVDECRDLCLNSPYKCRSYDYGDTGDMVCRLSHHSRATLLDVQEPYLDVPEASTYELSSCYNVTIECKPTEMVTKFKTSKLFNGKVYAKGSPNSCAVNVENTLEFSLSMGYNDLECNIRQSSLGMYVNDVVIQHHNTIVTSADLGLAVTCQFDLTNITVTNDHDMGVMGDLEPALYEDVIVDAPNVVMKITNREGGGEMMKSASVGDALALHFEIMDQESPYDIFVRDLHAMDGADSGEITLIDSRGCPTDQYIMGPIYRSKDSTKILISHFDAFKFPSSDQVQFRALVTPCMPSCEPVQCDINDIGEGLRSIVSFGRRRRRRSVNDTETTVPIISRKKRETKRNEEMLLVQSILIKDNFGGFDKQQLGRRQNKEETQTETVFVAQDHKRREGLCVNGLGLITSTSLFLLAQLAIIIVWSYLWQRRSRRKQINYQHDTILTGNVVPAGESMCKLYEGGYNTRHFN